MLNKKEFDSIRKDLKTFDEKRESVIQLSRSIIQLSKQVIYSLHRNEDPSKKLSEINAKIKELPKSKFDTNIDKVALQEYVEALTYAQFIKNKTIPTRKDLEVDTESYLLGLADLTGELVRKAANSVIEKKPKVAEDIRELVEQIYGQFLSFDLRNGELRRKSDQIKYNLQRLDSIVYDIKTK
tara:strand:+ start:3369 stop:3917 length:549 start_codon:yes stop_codon:yes gene_type:complete